LRAWANRRSKQRIQPIYTRYDDVTTTILAAPGEIQIHCAFGPTTQRTRKKTLDEISQSFELALTDRIFSQDGSSLEEVWRTF